jgi:hypothetical protein
MSVFMLTLIFYLRNFPLEQFGVRNVGLKDGSKQKDIWGADWIPFTQKMAYESIINIRPSQNNCHRNT